MLVEEQKVIREGLKILLEAESDIKVVGSSSNLQTALSKLEDLQPNIMLISMALSEAEGLDAIKAIQQKYDQIKIIIFCNQVDASDFVQYLELGVKGCLLKNISVGEIKEVIHYIDKGYTHIGNNVFKTVIPQLSDAITALQIADSELQNNLESQKSEIFVEDKFQFEPLSSTYNSRSNNTNNSFTENKIPPSPITMEGKVATDNNISIAEGETSTKDRWWKRGLFSGALVGLGLVASAVGVISYSRQAGRETEIVIKDAVVNGKMVSVDSPIEGKLQSIVDSQGMNIEADQVLAIIEPPKDINTANIISQLQKDIIIKQEQITNAKKFLVSLEKNLKILPKKDEISIKIPQAEEATRISIDNAREIANLEQQIINQKVTINLFEKELSNLQEKLTLTKENSVKNQTISIKAPITGEIYNTNYTLGELVPRSQEILTLIDCENLWIEAIIESNIAAKISLQKNVSVQLAEQETLIPGKITLIESLDAQSTTTNAESIVSTSNLALDNLKNSNASLSRVIVNLDFPTSELTPEDFCNVGLNATISINNK